MNHSVLWLSDWQCKAMNRPGSNKNWLRLGGLPSVEPIYWRKWVFPTKKKCSGAQGRRWSIARSPLDNSCLRRTPDFSLKATVKIYHIDILLSDISLRISFKNLSLRAMNLISENNTFWVWESESENIFFKKQFSKEFAAKTDITQHLDLQSYHIPPGTRLRRSATQSSSPLQGRHSLQTSRSGAEWELLVHGWFFTFNSGASIAIKTTNKHQDNLGDPAFENHTYVHPPQCRQNTALIIFPQVCSGLSCLSGRCIVMRAIGSQIGILRQKMLSRIWRILSRNQIISFGYQNIFSINPLLTCFFSQ